MSFKTILIPVDFTINTEVAVQKALALINDPGISIHLLHICRPGAAHFRFVNFFSHHNNHLAIERANQKLKKLEAFIGSADPGLIVHTWIDESSSVEPAVIKKAKEIKADLIIIGKSSQHWLPFFNKILSGRVAKQTRIPVLTVKPGAINRNIRTVVIPVGNQFSQSKITGMIALTKKTRIHICLLAFADSRDRPDQLPAALLNSYRLLKKSVLNDVSFDIIREHNKRRALLNYCKTVEADLLIVHPESETRSGWFKEHISDAMPAESRTQILAI